MFCQAIIQMLVRIYAKLDQFMYNFYRYGTNS